MRQSTALDLSLPMCMIATGAVQHQCLIVVKVPISCTQVCFSMGCLLYHTSHPAGGGAKLQRSCSWDKATCWISLLCARRDRTVMF